MKHQWGSTVTVVTWILLISFFSKNLMIQADNTEYINEPDNDGAQLNSIKHNLKKSWQNLQSSWGKRDFTATAATNDYYFDTKPWTTNYNRDDADGDDYETDKNNENNFSNEEKRGWTAMNNAWGKRVGSGSDWNKFRGAWGKREPGWNNLKGLWGKRAKWNKLTTAWGKRNSEN